MFKASLTYLAILRLASFYHKTIKNYKQNKVGFSPNCPLSVAGNQ